MGQIFFAAASIASVGPESILADDLCPSFFPLFFLF
jgi:hypothetical protein